MKANGNTAIEQLLQEATPTTRTGVVEAKSPEDEEETDEIEEDDRGTNSRVAKALVWRTRRKLREHLH